MVQSNSGKLYKLVDPKRYAHVAHFYVFLSADFGDQRMHVWLHVTEKRKSMSGNDVKESQLTHADGWK